MFAHNDSIICVTFYVFLSLSYNSLSCCHSVSPSHCCYDLFAEIPTASVGLGVLSRGRTKL